MDEMKNLLTVFNSLGEKIEQLTSEVKLERYYKEEYKAKAEALETENAKLAVMLEKVQHHIEKMEE